MPPVESAWQALHFTHLIDVDGRVRIWLPAEREEGG